MIDELLDSEPVYDAKQLAREFVIEALATMLANRAIENVEYRKDEEEFRRLGISPQRGSASRSGWQTRKANAEAGVVGIRTQRRRLRAQRKSQGTGEAVQDSAGALWGNSRPLEFRTKVGYDAGRIEGI